MFRSKSSRFIIISYFSWLYINQTDPDGTLGWLIEQLAEAEKVGDKVIIIGHIPNGIGGLDGWAKNYYQIVNRFESTIRAQIFAHEHFDTFHMFYDGVNYKNRVTNMVYVGPSLTTYSNTKPLFMQPAYRVYTIDGNYSNSTWTILNHETYFMDVTQSNIHDKPVWKLEYKAKEAYDLHSLLPKDWNHLIDRMETNTTLFKTFLRHYRRRDPHRCGHFCQMKYLCSLRTATTENLADKVCPEMGKRNPLKTKQKYNSRTPLMKDALKHLFSKCPINVYSRI